MSNTSNAVDFEVSIAGNRVANNEVMAIIVDDDLNQPAMCVVTLRNKLNQYNATYKAADTVEVKMGGGTRRTEGGTGDGDKQTVFKGEVVAVECAYKQGGDNRLSIRAFSKMHRMTRGKESKTWKDMSDQDVVSQIASECGLQADCGSTPKITHKHIYKHNQDNLSFLRVRAARLGFAVWCEDTKLYFKPPPLDADSGLEFVMDQQPKGGAGDKLKSFSGRLSTAQVLKKVTVRGWNPEKKEEVVGEAEPKNSPLGSSNAASGLGDFGTIQTYVCDHPVMSVDEAKAIAKAKLDEASMSFLTAEAEAMGNAKLKAGIVVKIKVNLDEDSDRFNGKYLVQGVTHRYTADNKGTEGGYSSFLRLCRDAEKGS